jgi:hypothetical protein
VDGHAIDLSQCLVLVEENVVRLVIACNLKRVVDTLFNVPLVHANLCNLVSRALFDVLHRDHVVVLKSKERILKAGISNVVKIIEEAKQIWLLVLNRFVQTSSVKCFPKHTFIRQIVLRSDLIFRRNEAVEPIREAFLLLYLVDTGRTLQRHNVRRKLNKLRYKLLVVKQLLQQFGVQIKSASIPQAHVDLPRLSVADFEGSLHFNHHFSLECSLEHFIRGSVNQQCRCS